MTMEDDYHTSLLQMVTERLDEALSSPQYLHSNEPMVPILRQMCANLLWLLSGAEKNSSSVLDSVSALRRLLKEKPRRECDTDRLISLVADALLMHLNKIVVQSGNGCITPTTPKNSSPIKPLTPSVTPTRMGIRSADPANTAPAAKKARLEAKINGLASKHQNGSPANGLSPRDSPLRLFSAESPISALMKNEPVEIICRVGSSEGNRTDDGNDDSGMMDASNGSEDNQLFRLLNQHGLNGDSPTPSTPLVDAMGLEEEAADGSGDEASYDFTALLMNNADKPMITDLPDFEDIFLNEPEIFSPSVSTIRKNTRRSKPEKIAEKGCTRVNRDPNAPRQVISAYLCFVGEMRTKRNNGTLHCNGGEFGQLLKSEWISLPDKTRYEMQHEEDKRRYERELADWARGEGRPVPGRKAYSFYVLETFERFVSENPHLPKEDIMMKVYISWRDLADKSRYFQLQQRDKERFRNEMKLFNSHNTANGLSGMAPGQVTMTTAKAEKITGEGFTDLQKFLDTLA